MIRHNPEPSLNGLPCLIVAVASALNKYPTGDVNLRDDGYATLNAANKFIRSQISVKRRKDYKRGERPQLSDLHLNGKGIVCVLGHYIYVDKEHYWSFFENETDDVVAVWEIKSITPA